MLYRPMVGKRSGSQNLFLVGRLFFRIGLLKPLEEGLSSLANLLGGSNIGVPFAGLGSPLLDHLLADEIVVVVQLQDLHDLQKDVWVFLEERSNEALSSAKQSLLALLLATNSLK